MTWGTNNEKYWVEDKSKDVLNVDAPSFHKIHSIKKFVELIQTDSIYRLFSKFEMENIKMEKMLIPFYQVEFPNDKWQILSLKYLVNSICRFDNLQKDRNSANNEKVAVFSSQLFS